jgi:hypothetical protein
MAVRHQTVAAAGRTTYPDYIANFFPDVGEVLLALNDVDVSNVTLSSARYTSGPLSPTQSPCLGTTRSSPAPELRSPSASMAPG